jgi:hypothetical protein
VQKNFRMSQKAVRLLHDVARARGSTETEVVEYCVSKYALDMGQDVDQAKELLFQHICRAAANSPVDVSRVRETGMNPAATSNTEVAAPLANRTPNIESAGQSAAGELAITAAEGASRKHGAGKKK